MAKNASNRATSTIILGRAFGVPIVEKTTPLEERSRSDEDMAQYEAEARKQSAKRRSVYSAFGDAHPSRFGEVDPRVPFHGSRE